MRAHGDDTEDAVRLPPPPPTPPRETEEQRVQRLWSQALSHFLRRVNHYRWVPESTVLEHFRLSKAQLERILAGNDRFQLQDQSDGSRLIRGLKSVRSATRR